MLDNLKYTITLTQVFHLKGMQGISVTIVNPSFTVNTNDFIDLTK